MNDFLLLRRVCHVLLTAHPAQLWPKGPQRLSVIVAILLMGWTLAYGQSYGPDSLSCDSLHTFRPTHLIVPAALVVAGSIGIESHLSHGVNDDVRTWAENVRGNRRFRADDYLQYVPALAYVGLGFSGVKAKHPFLERACILPVAWAAMGIMVNVTKRTVREKRPDSNARNSFPSGHTATAFMGAELIRREYGNAWGAGAYAFATGIGLLRIYNDRHWLADVLAGAGFGILSANIAYWLLPLERKLFRWNKQGRNMKGVHLLPSYQVDARAPLLTFSFTY